VIVSAADLVDAVIADMPTRNRAVALREELIKAWDTPRRWSIIREYYELRKDRIFAGHFTPYELGLERFLTPIEDWLWQDIRGMGLPFFMQYPVGRRFVDFGDPVQQIAIEADGAAWHTPEKDAKKDADLAAEGWLVFRVKGRDARTEAGTKQIENIARWY
jgi:very-short-patch-repair endonuclease